MSEKKETKQTQAQVQSTRVFLPEGFEPVSIEAVGVWTGERATYVLPVGYTLSDSREPDGGPPRVNAVIICKACDDVPVFLFGATQKGVKGTAKKGDYVAVYYRPGLRDLVRCGGVLTFVAPAGERKIEGRPDPMKLFTVATRGGKKGDELRLLPDKDFRVHTAGQPLPWEARARSDSGWASDDDIPF